MASNETEPVEETPIEKAVRERAAWTPDAQAEREADVVISDIDAYVAETDPASLPAAEAALESWQIPTDPLETGDAEPDDSPLEVVFSAGSESEASIVHGLLESAGIPTIMNVVSMPSYGGVFATGEARWGDLLVPARRVVQARAILTAAVEGKP